MRARAKKAIIPAAGLGTRFLPATKTVPKEMLTIVDAPIILYVVEEAAAAGIEDIILIQGRGKTAIEDFFDISHELEDKLAKDGKSDLLARVNRIRDQVNIISIRQKQPLGLGHAVLCGQSIVGDNPFAVLLGDEIMISENKEQNTTTRLCSIQEKEGCSCVAIMEVPESDVSKYGIADVNPIDQGKPPGRSADKGIFEVKGFVEKPKPTAAPSRWALPGRYVFDASIFSYLKNAKPGVNGEIQLTDSMNQLAQEKRILAATFEAVRFDAGDKLGYLKANVELGLRNKELREDLLEYLKTCVGKNKS